MPPPTPSAMASMTAAAPSRIVGGRCFPLSANRRAQLTALLLPAVKAFVLGYIMDILPAIIKALLRFTTSELKRIRTERKRLKEQRAVDREAASHSPPRPRSNTITTTTNNNVLATLKLIAPSLARLPLLLKAIVKALVVALGPHGMGLSCFWAMAGWKLSEALVCWPIAKYYALKLSTATLEPRTQEFLTRARIMATFVSASVSSALALMVLQHQSQLVEARAAAERASKLGGAKMLPPKPTGSEPLQIDTTSSWIPKPLHSPRFGFAVLPTTTSRVPMSVPKFASLAPAGHFLSRLTSLTVPGSPGRSPSFGSGGGAAAEASLPLSPDARQLASPTETRAMSHSAEASIDDGDSKQLQLPTIQVDATAAADGLLSKPSSSALGKPSPTIDLTLFALVRGLDTLVRAAPLLVASSGTAAALASKTASRPRSSRLSRVGSALSEQAEGLIFVVCCAQIMWTWFYHQERLPPTYVKWITNLATMDERLLLALRGMRYGAPINWSYKRDSNLTPASIEMISSLSEELGYPYEWGDPTRIPNTVAEARQLLLEARRVNAEKRSRGEIVQADPLRGGGGEPGFVFAGASGPRGRGEMGGLPCEIIHCGVGRASCARNAALRWLKGWKMSMAIYFPVHLLPRLLFNPRGFMKDPTTNLAKVLLGAARSAAFLATYIVGNWYPICLARTHLPRLFPSVAHSFWDAGLGPMLGSIACGFSIFIEEKRKRAEMALYVAPRALFAVVEGVKGGWLSQGVPSALYTERVIFGMAVGTVVSSARYKPDLLRGITGVIRWVVRPPGAERGRNRYARSQ